MALQTLTATEARTSPRRPDEHADSEASGGRRSRVDGTGSGLSGHGSHGRPAGYWRSKERLWRESERDRQGRGRGWAFLSVIVAAAAPRWRAAVAARELADGEARC